MYFALEAYFKVDKVYS
jgi:hypothetical protein